MNRLREFIGSSSSLAPMRQLWHGPLGAGSHRFVWDGRDEKGKAVAAGVYIYKVEVDRQVEAKKTTKLP